MCLSREFYRFIIISILLITLKQAILTLCILLQKKKTLTQIHAYINIQ